MNATDGELRVEGNVSRLMSLCIILQGLLANTCRETRIRLDELSCEVVITVEGNSVFLEALTGLSSVKMTVGTLKERFKPA